MSIENTIYNAALQDGIPDQLARLIVAQSKLETANYQHRFFTVGNNAFGYSYVPGAKWQLDKGGPLADNGIPIAQYRNVTDSTHELTDWIKRRQQEGKFPPDLAEVTSPDEYALLLKGAGYYTAPYSSYLGSLQYWFNNLPDLSKAIGGLMLVIAGGLVWFLARSKKRARK